MNARATVPSKTPQCSTSTANVSRRQQKSLSKEDGEQARTATMVPDATVLLELEAHARSIASSIDMALRDLRGSLRGMSDLTYESAQVFGSVVNSTCDEVDAAIRSTYAMLAKAEEFNESMRGIEKLLQQIKDVKRLLDLFEDQFAAVSISAPSRS